MGWAGKTGTVKVKEFARQSQITGCHLIIKGHMGNTSKAWTMHVEET